jgi:hypothetical protein
MKVVGLWSDNGWGYWLYNSQLDLEKVYYVLRIIYYTSRDTSRVTAFSFRMEHHALLDPQDVERGRRRKAIGW